ncbi:MAG TPA: N-acetyltransferase [Thermoanaerobaculia bacterium]|nr:N-acetyltransferase [Thermoanaerobaculia bacterium]
MTITIRAEALADLELIREVHLAAFPDATEADLVDRLRSEASSYLGLVAEIDGTVAGHLCMTEVTIENDGENRKGLGIAPMGVLPPYQTKGLGSRLVTAALDLAREKGVEFVVVLGEPDYYQRFGFRLAAPAVRWRSEEYDPYFQWIVLGGEHAGSLRGIARYHRAIEAL